MFKKQEDKNELKKEKQIESSEPKIRKKRKTAKECKKKDEMQE